ncbi:hypothetical protein GR328_05225 [Microvirga makkahensis]|uniref:C-type lysozyme inhibitor domain-containing protein n=2 Tax=Microvirga makkahensis TaxID=1128670 RepID=A0A7X3MPL2_9HYPH|nr:MliC family protein [Microvirga makkahensis]MXQ10859.1 hypothetical protein [Microvirga makkahensis]
MNRGAPVLAKAIWVAAIAVNGPGAIAQDAKPVHYTCTDGTRLQARFSPPSSSLGTVKLAIDGSSTQTILTQTISADGGRYTQGDITFWIKGHEATLTRAGQSTICRTGD